MVMKMQMIRRAIAAIGFLAALSAPALAAGPGPGPVPNPWVVANGQVYYPGQVLIVPSTTSRAGINVAPGVAPTSPNNGDMWGNASGLFYRANGISQGPFAALNI